MTGNWTFNDTDFYELNLTEPEVIREILTLFEVKTLL